jgi:hypothetical protein
MNICTCHNIVVWTKYEQNNLLLWEKCILFWITKKDGESQNLIKKQFSGIPLNAILLIIEVQNKARFNFKKVKLGKTGWQRGWVYNVADNTVY